MSASSSGEYTVAAYKYREIIMNAWNIYLQNIISYRSVVI